VLNVWPPRIPLTYRLPADLGENNALSRFMPKELAHLDAKRLSENPIAIGRMPPDFLFSAWRRPPKTIGATSEGQRRDNTRLTNAIKAVRKSWPDSWHIIMSRMCMLWAQIIRASSRAGWKCKNCPTDLGLVDQQTVILLWRRQITSFSRG